MPYEELNKVYDEYLENNNEQASEQVLQAYKNLREAFDCYADALTEFEWKCGYKYAKGVQ